MFILIMVTIFIIFILTEVTGKSTGASREATYSTAMVENSPF